MSFASFDCYMAWLAWYYENESATETGAFRE